jgi:DNA-binding transcriptional MerR regulator
LVLKSKQGIIYHMFYSSRHIATIFEITPQTVSVWAREFEEYLSPTATPGINKKRLFSHADMEILSLVSDLQKQGKSFTEIHAGLKAGQRGIPPAIEPDEVQAIVSGETETRLGLENERLRYALVQTQDALRKAQEELTQLQEVKDRATRLAATLESERAQRERLESQIGHLQQRIEELSKDAGHQYAKGYIEALREKGEMPKREGE